MPRCVIINCNSPTISSIQTQEHISYHRYICYRVIVQHVRKFATVEAFAKEGASVAFVGRNEAKLKEVASRCEQHGANVLAIRADVSKDEEANTIVQQTVDKFGKLDVLVNNAGILRFASVLDPNLIRTFDEVMNTNLRPVVLITSLAIPHLIATKGNVVNISSILSTVVRIPGAMSYSTSKAAMDHFTKFAALELAPKGVRVNSVNPGPVHTDIAANSGFAPNFLEDMGANIPLEKTSRTKEIADIICYLASDKAQSITGSCYLIDNGMALK